MVYLVSAVRSRQHFTARPSRSEPIRADQKRGDGKTPGSQGQPGGHQRPSGPSEPSGPSKSPVRAQVSRPGSAPAMATQTPRRRRRRVGDRAPQVCRRMRSRENGLISRDIYFYNGALADLTRLACFHTSFLQGEGGCWSAFVPRSVPHVPCAILMRESILCVAGNGL